MGGLTSVSICSKDPNKIDMCKGLDTRLVLEAVYVVMPSSEESVI